MNPETLPIVSRPSNTNKDIVERFAHITKIERKTVLCIGYSEEEIKEYIAKHNPKEIVCLTLWADHKDAQIKDYEIVIGDICKRTAFPDNTFDAVITLSLFEHLGDVEAALLEIKRVLKPTGNLYVFFGPAWSCGVGHHLYAKPSDPLLGFTMWQMPSHLHLLSNEEEIRSYYLNKGYTDDDCIHVIHWFYETATINRLMFDDYMRLFNTHYYLSASELMTVDIDESLLSNLRDAFPGYTDFSTYGGSFILKNRKAYDPYEIFDGELSVSDRQFSSFFKRGFYGIEGDSFTWRWSHGDESEIVVPLHENSNYELQMTVMPLQIPKRQVISVHVNDRHVGDVKLNDLPQFGSYSVQIPRNCVKDVNSVIFKYAYSISPNDTDPRKLGACFSKFKFVKT